MPAWRLGVPTCSSRLKLEQASEQRNTVDHNSGIMTECGNDSNDARAPATAHGEAPGRGTAAAPVWALTDTGTDRHPRGDASSVPTVGGCAPRCVTARVSARARRPPP